MFRSVLPRHHRPPTRPGLAARWPSQCLICRAWPAQRLCADCVHRFAPTIVRCTTCALPVPPGVRRCGACVVSPPPMDACLAAVTYQWPWTRCMGQFKFRQDASLAAALATLLQRVPGMRSAIDDADWVLPLPLSDERLAERGYNPSLLLARQLAPRGCRADLLLRLRHTPPQHTLPRAKRLNNVRGAFAVEPLAAATLRGRRVVLLDDVMTTGASVREAAATLRAAGADHITVVVFARTDEHR